MDKKFTQGPWRYDCHMFPDGHVTKSISSNKIAICVIRTNNIDQAEANAKLITAAPELLEACESAKEIIDYIRSIDLYINLWSDKRQMFYDASAKLDASIKKALL